MSLLDVLMPRFVPSTKGARAVQFHAAEFKRDEEVLRKKRSAYDRKRYRTDGEKKRDKTRRYYLKNRARCLALSRAWRRRNLEYSRKQNRDRMRRMRAAA